MCPSVRGAFLPLPPSTSSGPTFWSCRYPPPFLYAVPNCCIHPPPGPDSCSRSHSSLGVLVRAVELILNHGHPDINLWLTERDIRQGFPTTGLGLGVTHSRGPGAMGFPGPGASPRQFRWKQGPGTPLGSQCHFVWMPEESAPAVTPGEESGTQIYQSGLRGWAGMIHLWLTVIPRTGPTWLEPAGTCVHLASHMPRRHMLGWFSERGHQA